MEQEDPSPFTPPVTSRTPTFLIALALAVAVYAGWRYADGWSVRDVEPTARTAEPAPRREASPLPEASVPSPVQSAAKVEPEAPVAWVRCEANGRIVYSDKACDGTATQKSSSATTHAALSTLPSGSGKKGTTTIYRCKGFSGTLFWSSTHCNQKEALIDRLVTVPRGLSLQQQIRVAEASVPRAAPTLLVPSTSRASQQVAPAASVRKSECKTLGESIGKIDTRARQAISAREQDWLREQRRAARDRQFALRC